MFCRCRPLNAEEIAEGASAAIDFESAKDGELVVKGHVSSKKVFKFDSVFSPEEDQGNSLHKFNYHFACIFPIFLIMYLFQSMCRKGV